MRRGIARAGVYQEGSIALDDLGTARLHATFKKLGVPIPEPDHAAHAAPMQQFILVGFAAHRDALAIVGREGVPLARTSHVAARRRRTRGVRRCRRYARPLWTVHRGAARHRCHPDRREKLQTMHVLSDERPVPPIHHVFPERPRSELNWRGRTLPRGAVPRIRET
jgi:hypothetical protein